MVPLMNEFIHILVDELVNKQKEHNTSLLLISLKPYITHITWIQNL